MNKLLCVIFVVFAFASAGLHAQSKCTETSSKVSCSSQKTKISAGAGSREVEYELPNGVAPAGGWPVAIMYQGTFFAVSFTRNKGAPFGGFNEARLIKRLLDNGYAVLVPRALANFAWLTNASGPLYNTTSDYRFITNILKAIKDGTFGNLNPDRQFATGISSGGYNTSRMAVSWPGEFKALAIQSGSYATCLGPLCNIPSQLPADHPPTFFMHGSWDPIVGIGTMRRYNDRLKSQGIPTGTMIKFKGHSWFNDSPKAVVDWFNRYNN